MPKLPKSVWVAIVVVVLVALVALPILLKGQGGIEGVRSSPGQARSFYVKVGIDGKECLDVSGGVVPKKEDGKAEAKDTPRGHEGEGKGVPKSVAELEREIDTDFKEQFEGLLGRSAPMKGLNDKFDKLKEDHDDFKKSTKKSLDEIDGKLVGIAGTLTRISDAAGVSKKEEKKSEKKD